MYSAIFLVPFPPESESRNCKQLISAHCSSEPFYFSIESFHFFSPSPSTLCTCFKWILLKTHGESPVLAFLSSVRSHLISKNVLIICLIHLISILHIFQQTL